MSHPLTSTMLNNAAGIEMAAVPYRGTAPAVNDILGGTILLLWSTPVGLMQFIEQGRLKALGVTTPQRVPLLPKVPTLAESVAPGLADRSLARHRGPAGIPGRSFDAPRAAIREIVAMPEVRKRITDIGQSLEYLPAAQFRERLDRDQERLGVVIREAGIQPN